MPPTIFSFGEILWDLLPNGAQLGGAPFNVAFRMHESGDNVYIVSRLGRDRWGMRARAAVQRFGLSDACLQTDRRRPTGTVEVTFDAGNNPDYRIVPDVAYDHIALTGDLKRLAARADCVCFGSLAQRSPVSRATLRAVLKTAHNAFRFYDVNLRRGCYTPEIVRFSLSHADAIKLNDHETDVLGRMLSIKFCSIPRFCEELMRRWKSLKFCLVTLGARGAYARSRDGDEVYVPGYRITVADTVGAGDAFSAGFVHALLHGRSLGDACELGNVLGAIVATQKGATRPISSRMRAAFVAKKTGRIVDPAFRRSWIE
jgi:fructokinase